MSQKEEEIERWKDLMKNIIGFIQEEKKSDGKAPVHAMQVDVTNLLNRRAKYALNLLVKEGEIKAGKTLNSNFYQLKDGSKNKPSD